MCDISHPIQIAVLGDKAVGKSSIIRQWLFNDFHIRYNETRLATYHFTSLYNGQRLFHIRIIDTPRFDENDTDPQQEWVKLYCFRRCALFLMVFDINREETFTYIKQIYREIVRVRTGGGQFSTMGAASGAGTNQSSQGYLDDDTMAATIGGGATSNVGQMPAIIIVANKADLINLDQRYSALTNSREITNYAKKTFKANTIQCSAKYHWHLVLLFKEVCRMLETVEETVSKNLSHHGRRQRHCHIM